MSRPAETVISATKTSGSGGGAAMPTTLTSGHDRRLSIPTAEELDEAAYVREVLGESRAKTEADIEEECKARALELGIRPTPLKAMCGRLHATTASKYGRILGTVDDDGVSRSHSSSSRSRVLRRLSTSSSTTTLPSALNPGRVLSSGLVHLGKTLGDENGADWPHATTSMLSLASYLMHGNKSLDFTRYDCYVDQVLQRPSSSVAGKLAAMHLRPTPSEVGDRETNSSEASSLRKGVKGLRGFSMMRLRKKNRKESIDGGHGVTMCATCHCEFTRDDEGLHTLRCRHAHCRPCLNSLILESASDQAKMPPTCCDDPIPSATIQSVLNRDDQALFLRAVQLFSTPWESRVFCPSVTCGVFIPNGTEVDVRRPFDATCKLCRRCACIMCKQLAHGLGERCPEDWELAAMINLTGGWPNWRRCYRCRALVQRPADGRPEMVCRCRASVCGDCGAVWDPARGCPNFCHTTAATARNHDVVCQMNNTMPPGTLHRTMATASNPHTTSLMFFEAERLEAAARSVNRPEFVELAARQQAECARFEAFERQARLLMWTRHSHRKLWLSEEHAAVLAVTDAEHAEAEQRLEERQLRAELELLDELDQQARRTDIKLKHMEAFCQKSLSPPSDAAPTTSPSGPTDPPVPRHVTPQHLAQLNHQYRLRDCLARQREARIHILRETQAQVMEDLLSRQADERAQLLAAHGRTTAALSADGARDEVRLNRLFGGRRMRLQRRWELAIEILCRELERRSGLRYAPIKTPTWSRSVGEDEDEDEDEEGGVRSEEGGRGGGGGGWKEG